MLAHTLDYEPDSLLIRNQIKSSGPEVEGRNAR